MDEEVQKLILNFYNKDSAVRENASKVLGKIGLPAVPSLIGALGNGNADVRRGVAWVLREIANKHPEHDWSGAVPALIRALGDGDLDARMNAAFALGKMGLSAVPALIGALGDGNADVRWSAAFALGEIGLRDYKDLKMIATAAREAKKEGKPVDGFARVYSAWSRRLNAWADKIVEDKKIHVPQIKKPDRTDRVLRVRRVGWI